MPDIAIGFLALFLLIMSLGVMSEARYKLALCFIWMSVGLTIWLCSVGMTTRFLKYSEITYEIKNTEFPNGVIVQYIDTDENSISGKININNLRDISSGFYPKDKYVVKHSTPESLWVGGIYWTGKDYDIWEIVKKEVK